MIFQLSYEEQYMGEFSSPCISHYNIAYFCHVCGRVFAKRTGHHLTSWRVEEGACGRHIKTPYDVLTFYSNWEMINFFSHPLISAVQFLYETEVYDVSRTNSSEPLGSSRGFASPELSFNSWPQSTSHGR